MGTGEVGLSPFLGGIEGLVSSHCDLFQGLLCTPGHPRGFPLCCSLSFVHSTSHQAHCPVSPEILPYAHLPPALWSEQTPPLTVFEALAE